jgi:hypothetical protein
VVAVQREYCFEMSSIDSRIAVLPVRARSATGAPKAIWPEVGTAGPAFPTRGGDEDMDPLADERRCVSRQPTFWQQVARRRRLIRLGRWLAIWRKPTLSRKWTAALDPLLTSCSHAAGGPLEAVVRRTLPR